MTKISFIYFDVGGVAIKDFSDTPKWDIMISDALGIQPQSRDEFDILFDKYEDDICEGKIAVDDLRPFLKEHFDITLSPNFSILQYFVDNFELNDGFWEIVRLIDPQIKLGLFTDQYLGMLDKIFAKNLIPKIKFDTIVDSSVVGIRKPKSEIYQIAQQKAVVPPGEILFIDNREKNLVPARALGWQTYLYDSSNYEKSSQDLSAFLSQNL